MNATRGDGGAGAGASTRILEGDALTRMAELPAASIGACVTDPPYGLKFMGKAWDHGVPGEPYWREALRVLQPGGHLVAFGGTRTYHRLTCAIEDAGFEIRDCLMWLYGSGFPKSLDVSKAIDRQRQDNPDWQRVGAWLRVARSSRGLSAKATCEAIGAHGEVNHGGAVSNWENGLSCPTWGQWLALKAALNFGADMDAEVWRLNGRKGQPGEAWAEREVIGQGYRVRRESTVQIAGCSDGAFDLTAPATDAARQWAGWGTALKPGWEPVVLARKPLEGSVATNVAKYGVGALNVDGCRIAGRWPANVVLSHEDGCREIGTVEIPSRGGSTRTDSLGRMNDDGWQPQVQQIKRPSPTVAAWECVPECAVRLLDEQSGIRQSGGTGTDGNGTKPGMRGNVTRRAVHVERTPDIGGASRFFYCSKASSRERGPGNDWPTVKPLALMQWLVRLVTPKGGTVLDPFCGSGSTLLAASREGFDAIGIDSDPHAVEIARQRLTDHYGPLMAALEVSA
jgi:hypothetical protein